MKIESSFINKKMALALFLFALLPLYAMKEVSQNKRKISFAAEASIPKKARTNDVVIVIDAQGRKHNITKEAALYADLIESMLEEEAHKGEAIPLPNIQPQIMERLVQRLTLLSQPQQNQEDKEKIKNSFNETFINLSPQELYEDARAADYVGANELLQLITAVLTHKMINVDPSGQGMMNQLCALDDLHIRSIAGDVYHQYLKSTTGWTPQLTLRPAIGEGVDEITTAAFSHDGTRLAIGLNDNQVYIYDTNTQQQIGQLQGHGDAITAIAFSPDGTKIVTGSDDDTIRIWNANTHQPISEPLSDHDGSIHSIVFSADGTKIATGSDDNIVHLWDARTHQLLGVSQNMRGHITSVAFSPDGTAIVAGSTNKNAYIWDLNLQQVHILRGDMSGLRGHKDGIFTVAFSPDGTKVATGSLDKTARIWDARTYQQIGNALSGHAGIINSIAFSPDGKKIITGSDDEMTYIWDVNSQQLLGILRDQEEPLPIHLVAFSPDGTHIFTGSKDNAFIIWHQPAAEKFMIQWKEFQKNGCPEEQAHE